MEGEEPTIRSLGVDGLKFRLHPPEHIDGSIFTEGLYELNELRFIRRRFRGRTMLDIGANIGNHSLYLAPNFKDIHAFEPNPITADRLRQNIELNRAAIHVHEVGLGDADAKLEFRSSDTGNLGGGSFTATRFPVSHCLQVVQGDGYIADRGIRNVDFIKLDVEGFELKVLDGLAKTIERDRPVIVMEYDGRRGSQWTRLRSALPGYGFFIMGRKLIPLVDPGGGFLPMIFALPLTGDRAATDEARS